MQCNIDQRGRIARLINGSVTAGFGGTVIWFGIYSNETWVVVTGAFLCVAGAFMIFEGAKGWCALRALGFKTRI